MTQVKSYYFDPLLATKDDITSFLADKDYGSAHPWSGDLIIKTEKGFIQEKIGDPQQYLNTTQLGNIEESVDQALRKYIELRELTDYSLQFSNCGDTLTISPGSLEGSPSIFSFMVTEKTSSDYFDFVVYYLNPDQRSNSLQVLTYNTQSSSVGLSHSGDIGSLLHITSLADQQMPMGTMFLLAAVGFHKRPIRSFQNQVPVFFLVDHQASTINMVPVPLDQMTVGDSTMVGLVIGKKCPDGIRFYLVRFVSIMWILVL